MAWWVEPVTILTYFVIRLVSLSIGLLSSLIKWAVMVFEQPLRILYVEIVAIKKISLSLR